MWPGNSGNQNTGRAPPAFPNPGNYAPSPGPTVYDPSQPQAPFFPSPQPSPAPRGFGGPPPVSRDNYPGHQHHHHHHQPPLNNDYPGQYGGSYALPTGPPTPYAPPQGPPGGYGPPPGPPIGYAPPQGPPEYAQPQGYPGVYAPPPGPPGAPGYGPPPGPRSGYAPPQGPPGGYGAPPGPPQQNYGYAQGGPPPSGPPFGQQSYGLQAQGPGQAMQQSYGRGGRKKALLIGINYQGQKAALKGCVQDVRNMKQFLLGRGYREEDIKMLIDEPGHYLQPTRENMLSEMSSLVMNCQYGDSFFFHYSGHGGQTKDLDGDEEDGFDEVIYPVDYERNGHIVDDVMHEKLVKPLQEGHRLTAIFDSCHSGSALDLPYIYSTEGKIKEPNMAAGAAKGALSAVMSLQKNDIRGLVDSVTGLVNIAGGRAQKANQYAKATKTSNADVISWSGCKDSQTSADTQIAGKSTGAMSYAFLQALGENPNPSYQQLLLHMRNTLAKGNYNQKPQLSASHPIDTQHQFTV